MTNFTKFPAIVRLISRHLTNFSFKLTPRTRIKIKQTGTIRSLLTFNIKYITFSEEIDYSNDSAVLLAEHIHLKCEMSLDAIWWSATDLTLYEYSLSQRKKWTPKMTWRTCHLVMFSHTMSAKRTGYFWWHEMWEWLLTTSFEFPAVNYKPHRSLHRSLDEMTFPCNVQLTTQNVKAMLAQITNTN